VLRRTWRSRSFVAVIALLGVACSSGSEPATATARATTTVREVTSTSGPPNRALAALATLAVKGRAPKTGYDREEFGPSWSDADHNGCDTRNDILNRDLTARTWRAGTHGCVVLTGTLAEPYTGRSVAFDKSRAIDVHIDHVVALADAWQKGGQLLTAARRLAFANDPLNLLAVDGPTNAAKGDGDAATWLPPNKPFRCAYVARQVAVKARYALWTTPAEHAAIARVLATCPGQSLPTATRAR
jgi:hypothetical protein